jgi:hypothetical protein
MYDNEAPPGFMESVKTESQFTLRKDHKVHKDRQNVRSTDLEDGDYTQIYDGRLGSKIIEPLFARCP